MTKTALVTGGARGIGRACALALADSGFDIALVDLLEKEMAATARDIEARGRRTLTFQADVSDFTRAHAIVEQINAKWAHLDVLLNNAGAPNPKPILDITEAEFDRTIAVNLKSCFNFIHACAPIMLKQDTGGRIISISSINALSGGVTSAVSKHAYADGQGRNPGPDALACQGARTQGGRECDLPGRDRDRPVARSARRAGGSVDRRDCHGPGRQARGYRQHRALSRQWRRTCT